MPKELLTGEKINADYVFNIRRNIPSMIFLAISGLWILLLHIFLLYITDFSEGIPLGVLTVYLFIFLYPLTVVQVIVQVYNTRFFTMENADEKGNE